MSDTDKALATIPAETISHGASDIFSLMPRTFEGVQKFCEILAGSDLVPKDYKDKPANIFVALQMGSEIGLSPMQALQNVAVISGRPSLWGDAVLAVCQGSGKLEYIREWHEGDTAHCEVKRRGYPAAKVVTFSQQDAAKMGLAGKPGPWTQIPQRMRQMRARAFALRDQFADVLKGVATAEEIIDVTPLDVTQATQPEAPKPATQDDKGASVREKMAKQLPPKREAAPSESAPPDAKGLDDSAWADLCVLWAEEDAAALKKCCSEFQVPSVASVKPLFRTDFSKRMGELRKESK